MAACLFACETSTVTYGVGGAYDCDAELEGLTEQICVIGVTWLVDVLAVLLRRADSPDLLASA